MPSVIYRAGELPSQVGGSRSQSRSALNSSVLAPSSHADSILAYIWLKLSCYDL